MTPARPDLHFLNAEDARLAWWAWRRDLRGAGSTLVFAHATGFHGRMWDSVIERLGDRHAIAFDMRGHGRSNGGPVDHWRVFASDIAAVLQHAGISGAIGVGHSMGGHALLQAASDNPGTFERLVLFDPVVFNREAYELPPEPDPASESVARRRSNFATVEEFRDRFSEREPYSLFDRRVFADYCDHALEPRPNREGLQLACPPLVEASVYGSSKSNGAILEAASNLPIPVLIIRAKQDDTLGFQSSPTWPGLADFLPEGHDLYRPDMTHFHPYQDPVDAAKIIAGWIGGEIAGKA